MEPGSKFNPAVLIDPNQLYEVDYSIDQSGKKHVGKMFLKGCDLTEKQILSMINKVDISGLIPTK